MKINLTILLSGALIALMISPLQAQRRNISVSDFDQISMARSGTVYVTQGNETRVEVVASDDIFEDLDIEVRGGDLVIKNKTMRGWGGSKGKLEVYVTTPEINGLAVSGSGRIITENKVNTRNLRVAVSGSGKVISHLEADKVSVSISGSGNAELSGNCKNIDASISGSGRIQGEDLETDNCEATISGSGGMDIQVNESIDARISGSGSIRYHGNPDHVNSKTSGSGSVKKVG